MPQPSLPDTVPGLDSPSALRRADPDYPNMMIGAVRDLQKRSVGVSETATWAISDSVVPDDGEVSLLDDSDALVSNTANLDDIEIIRFMIDNDDRAQTVSEIYPNSLIDFRDVGVGFLTFIAETAGGDNLEAEDGTYVAVTVTPLRSNYATDQALSGDQDITVHGLTPYVDYSRSYGFASATHDHDSDYAGIADDSTDDSHTLPELA